MSNDTQRVEALEAWVQRARTQVGTADATRGHHPLPAHVGLWLDRCYFEPPTDGKGGQDQDQRSGDKPGRRALYDAAISALRFREPPPPAIAHYRQFFSRWEQWAKSVEPGVVRCSRSVQATSRVLLHPATGCTVTEGGLLLHHTYGVPYLPGSALKGIARRRAWAQRDKLSKEQRTALFGFDRDETESTGSQSQWERQDEAGAIDFCDALWVPEQPSEDGADFSPLALDIVNPHHTNYYTNAQSRPYHKESDEPVPTLLLSIRPGTHFLLVLEAAEFAGGLGQDWLNWICDNLVLPALEEDGIGARTSAGYGRLKPNGNSPELASVHKAPELHRGRATVTYQRGNGELKARFTDGRTATVRSIEAQSILETLSEGVRGKLKNGKATSLTATWEPVGNARRLVELREE